MVIINTVLSLLLTNHGVLHLYCKQLPRNARYSREHCTWLKPFDQCTSNHFTGQTSHETKQLTGQKSVEMFTIFCIIHIVLLLSKNTRVHQSEEKDTKFSMVYTPF
jgi:hypothetical protein